MQCLFTLVILGYDLVQKLLFVKFCTIFFNMAKNVHIIFVKDILLLRRYFDNGIVRSCIYLFCTDLLFNVKI